MYKYGTDEWNEAYSKLVEERKESQSKPYVAFTPEWISDYEKAVQDDERYKKVAKTWEGSVVLVVQADPKAGIDEDIFIFMDLWHGECHFIKPVSPEAGRAGEYVLEAEYERWKRIMKKELNVVKEIATRKLKLVPFNFKKAAKLAAAAQAALRLVELSSTLGARFPDELDAEELGAFKAFLGEMRPKFWS